MYTLMGFLLQAVNWHFLIAYPSVNKTIYVGTCDFGFIVEIQNFKMLLNKVLC